MTKRTIMREHGEVGLLRFLSLCDRHIEIDYDTARAIAASKTKYYRGSQRDRVGMRHLQDMEARWYASVEAGDPDYSVYDDPYYCIDTWTCWSVYSRTYLRDLANPRLTDGTSVFQMIGRPRAIADLGCGCGYTTAAFAEAFPHARVYGTQLPTSAQYRMAEEVSRGRRFSLVPSVHQIPKNGEVDVVFASEYFEHFLDPFTHVKEVVDACKPEWVITANAFTATSIGHFPRYYDGLKEEWLTNKQTGRRFNRLVRDMGYEQPVRYWNNRPAAWRRV